MSEARREWKIGPHTIVFEPPKLLRVRYEGDILLHHAICLVQLYGEVARAGAVDIISDMSSAAPLTPEVQRHLGENIRTEWFRFCVYFGARLVHKALIKGIILSGKLLTGNVAAAEEFMTRTHYVATRDDAEQLMHALRAHADSPEG